MNNEGEEKFRGGKDRVLERNVSSSSVLLITASHCTNVKVRRSGLWNADHVTEERWEPALLDEFEVKVRRL